MEAPIQLLVLSSIGWEGNNKFGGFQSDGEEADLYTAATEQL